MKKLLTFSFLLFIISSMMAQTIVDPNTFTEKTTADGTEAIYTREDSVNRKIKLSNAKKYLTPDVQTTLIAYEPASTGNSLNLMEFVKHNSNGKIWYIDSAGDAFLLYDPTALVTDADKGDITVSGSGATWSLDNDVVGSDELASSGVTAGTYGSTSLVPVVTIDVDGRVTNVSTVSVTTASVSDGDKGDIDVSSSGTVWTLDTSAVTTLEILDETISASDIDTGAVTTSEILDATIATADLADSLVTSAKIISSAIEYNHLSSAVRNSIDAGGSVIDEPAQNVAKYMPRTNSKIINSTFSGSEKVKVVILGDSNTNGGGATAIKSEIEEISPNVGTGYCSFTNSSGVSAPLSWTRTHSGTWTHSGGPGASFTKSIGSTGATVTYTPPSFTAGNELLTYEPYKFTKIKIYYEGDASGQFRLSIDGTWTDTVTLSGSGLKIFEKTGLTDVRHTFIVEILSGPVTMYGAWIERASQAGSIVSKHGQSGAGISTLGSNLDSASFINQLQDIDPTLVIINFGTNDFSGSVSTYMTTYRTAFTKLRDSLPDADIMIIACAERGEVAFQNGNAELFRDSLLSFSKEQKVSFVDLYSLHYPWASTFDAGNMDSVHYTSVGHTINAKEIVKTIYKGESRNKYRTSRIKGRLALSDPNGNVIIGGNDITSFTGLHTQGTDNIKIGSGAGYGTTAIDTYSNSTLIGKNAGQSSTASGVIALGYQAAQTSSAAGSINIGETAGSTGSGTYPINIGWLAGKSNTANYALNLGARAGEQNTGAYAINIGYTAGQNNTYNYAVNIGGAATQTGEVVLGYPAQATRLTSRNYKFNIDQTLSSTQDGFVLAYNNGTGEIEAVATSKLNRTLTSAAATLTLASTYNHYVFTGTTSTWTLPTVAGNTNVKWYLKNRGSGDVTINTAAAGNDIYSSSPVNTYTLTAGSAIVLFNDGTYFNVE